MLIMPARNTDAAALYALGYDKRSLYSSPFTSISDTSMRKGGPLAHIMHSIANYDWVYSTPSFMKTFEPYLPDALQEEEVDWEEFIFWNNKAAYPREWDGEEVSARERNRRWMRSLIPGWDDLNTIFFTLRVKEDSPTVVQWDYIHNDVTRTREMSLVKFCGMLNHKHGFNIPAEVSQEWSEFWGQAFGTPDFSFELSSYVYETYDEGDFESCMSGSTATRFYDHQDNVQVLRIINDNTGELAGRALVWSNVQERKGSDNWTGNFTFMDRVYPSDGGYQVKAAVEHAIENGWIFLDRQGVGADFSRDGIYRVRIEERDEYPYMDTFAYSDSYPARYLATNDVGLYGYEWRSTDGYSPFEDEDYYEDDDDY